MTFPLFIELKDLPCLVVGGGEVASRKAQTLSAFGAAVKMIAGMDAVGGTDIPPVRVVRRNFADGDIEGMSLVVSATDDRELNRHISELCKAKGILVNVVDDPANCTFVFPAIFRKGPIVAAVSSGGACPVAAKLVRDKVARLVPDDFASAVEELGARRAELKRTYPDPHERRRVCEEALAKWKD